MLALLASALIALSAGDTTLAGPINQLVHTAWTTKDGAPADIRTLAQTRDGYLWLGTGAGLFRFDGVRFVQFTPRGGDSLPRSAVSRLMTTRDASLWVVWANGAVSRLRDGRVTSYGERDGLPPTFQLTESSHGVLLAGTAKGLARFADGKWHDLGPAWDLPGKEARAVWFDRNDVLWVETLNFIGYLPPGAQHFAPRKTIVVNRASPADFSQERDGTVWVNELARSAHTVRLVGDTVFPSEVRVQSTTVLVDRKGSLWVGTAGDGLRRVIDPTQFRGKVIARFSPEAEQFTMKDGLLSDVITALLEDREGSIWVASTGGVERFRKGAFTPIAPIGPGRSRLVFAARDTSVWTSVQDMTGVLRFTQRDSATVPTDFFITNLAQDSAGSIYTVGVNQIYKFDGRRFAPLSLEQNGGANDLIDVTVDPSGTVWVFDQQVGLLRLNHNSLIRVASFYQPSRRGVLLADRRGRIWVGQVNRVALYDHGQLSLFGQAEGVPQGLVFQLMEDHAGNVWAVGDGGVSKFENGRFRTISARRGVPGGSVMGIVEDDTRAWWLATRMGVFRLSPGELDRALADSNYVVRYRAFDQLDGLPGTINQSTMGPLLSRARDGRIWLTADRGVASVDPRTLPPAPPPPVLIEAMRVDGRELMPAETMAVPPERGDLAIDYTAATLSNAERIQFRYRLEGQDHAWTDAGTRRRADYPSLRAGEYRFHVIASNGDGAWNEAGAVLAFRILPAWYQTLWFQSGVVVLIVGVGAGAASLVQRQRYLRSQQLLTSGYEATLSERARIAQDLHDTVLQGIAGMSMQLKAAERALPDEPDVAAEILAHVQRLTRQTLREARDRVLDLHEPDVGDDDVAGALTTHAEGLVAATGIAFCLTTHGERRRLPRALEVAAIRIGREAIANAVRHAEAHRIEVAVGFEPAALRVEVRDDGRGFTPEQGERAREHGHLGLTGMRNRAEAAGATCAVRSSPGGGTVVTVEMPLDDG